MDRSTADSSTAPMIREHPTCFTSTFYVRIGCSTGRLWGSFDAKLCALK
jgi:hypothetical protein